MMTRKQAEALATRTQDAYSADRYRSWAACALALSQYDERTAEAILRSKHMRWAADEDGAEYGRVTSSALVRYMAKYPKEFTPAKLAALVAGTN